MVCIPQLAQRLYNRPLAMLPDGAELAASAVMRQLGLGRMLRAPGRGVASGRPMMNLAADIEDDDEGPEAYDLVVGVAIITISGMIVQKLGTLRPAAGYTGCDGIRMAFLTALQDPAVRAIALSIDSPGGEVAGCFDLVDTIHRARGSKPIWAILNENACSAAYAIASAADRITIPRTGRAGSIGIITMHIDFSRALAKGGLAITMLQFGDRKADGNQVEPLSQRARAGYQAEADTLGRLFVATVARNRGLPAARVSATEAATYLGPVAVANCLADAVLPADAALADLVRSLRVDPKRRGAGKS
jgi:ClpP class serine protease